MRLLESRLHEAPDRDPPNAGESERRIDQLSKRTRRVVAVATLVGLPAMFLWSSFWMGTAVPSFVWGPVTFALVGATLVGAFVLYRFVRDRADMPGARLDERERQLP